MVPDLFKIGCPISLYLGRLKYSKKKLCFLKLAKGIFFGCSQLVIDPLLVAQCKALSVQVMGRTLQEEVQENISWFACFLLCFFLFLPHKTTSSKGER